VRLLGHVRKKRVPVGIFLSHVWSRTLSNPALPPASLPSMCFLFILTNENLPKRIVHAAGAGPCDKRRAAWSPDPTRPAREAFLFPSERGAPSHGGTLEGGLTFCWLKPWAWREGLNPLKGCRPTEKAAGGIWRSKHFLSTALPIGELCPGYTCGPHVESSKMVYFVLC
jgi:hypothetical protein